MFSPWMFDANFHVEFRKDSVFLLFNNLEPPLYFDMVANLEDTCSERNYF
jgi:hypothetical protein